MTIRIIINGAKGRMGQLAVKTLLNQPEFAVVGQLSRNDDLAAEIKKSAADIVVDLTTAESAFTNAQTIIQAGAHPVIGTSGLINDQVQQLQEMCSEKKLGGIIAPNFSIGAVLMMKYSQDIVKYYPDVEIIEMHHNGKLDSPSGTAIRTAELLAAARINIPNTPEKTRENIPGARGALYQKIPIHAIRLPGLVAHQQILFGGVGETLTLKHDSIDRLCFMPGIVLACQKVTQLRELIYGLEHIL
jgi:4-hydroxy-tetrahydrodipicolinate reductase